MADNPVFKSWKSYWNFADEVTRRRRYLFSSDSRAFLDTLMRTSESRQSKLREGHHLCRAQVAHADRNHPDVGTIPGPALPNRMIPRPDKATDGRANPRGIPCLYMADNRHTAIAEVRPWIGSLVSVGIMRLLREQRVVDCRCDDKSEFLFLEGEPTPAEREATVWRHVSRAFREPVLRDDDRGSYSPTQIIAEAFREHGYDGLVYGSGFGTGATNIVLFDTSAAELVACEIHEIRDVKLDRQEVDNPYFVQKDESGEITLVRTVITAIGPVDGPMTSLDPNDETNV